MKKNIFFKKKCSKKSSLYFFVKKPGFSRWISQDHVCQHPRTRFLVRPDGVCSGLGRFWAKMSSLVTIRQNVTQKWLLGKTAPLRTSGTRKAEIIFQFGIQSGGWYGTMYLNGGLRSLKSQFHFFSSPRNITTFSYINTL